MDPTKPASKSNGGTLPIADRKIAEPKKSFQATLAERKKKDATAQAPAPDEELDEALRIAEEQMAIQMSRSVLQAPKPSKMSSNREKSEVEEEG